MKADDVAHADSMGIDQFARCSPQDGDVVRDRFRLLAEAAHIFLLCKFSQAHLFEATGQCLQ